MQKVSIPQFTAGSLFKLGLLANVGIWIPLSIAFGLAAMAGFNTVRMGGAPVHGFPGFLISLLFGGLSILIGSLLFTVGAKLISLFGDRLPRLIIRESVADQVDTFQ